MIGVNNGWAMRPAIRSNGGTAGVFAAAPNASIPSSSRMPTEKTATGFRRFGWLGWHAVRALVTLAMVVVFAGLEGLEAGGGVDDVARQVWQVLTFTAGSETGPSEEGVDYWMLPWFIGAMWGAMLFETSFHLRSRGRVYGGFVGI